MRRPSDRRSRPRRASTPAKSSRRRASVRRAPTHPMRAARSEYDAPSVRTADASDIGPQHPARYGQNDCEIALGRKSWLFAGSDRGGERAAVMYSADRHRQAQRRRSASLARRRARSHRRASGAKARRTAALELASAQGAGQSGSLIMAGISYVFTIARVAKISARRGLVTRDLQRNGSGRRSSHRPRPR